MEILAARRRQGAISELVVVAPPRALGMLRKVLPHALGSLFTAELPKDLVKHPLHEIERILAADREAAEAA